MQFNVELTAAEIAAAMHTDCDFGAAVIIAFLDEIGRHPSAFADAATFRQCRVMTADQLRSLATAIATGATR